MGGGGVGARQQRSRWRCGGGGAAVAAAAAAAVALGALLAVASVVARAGAGPYLRYAGEGVGTRALRQVPGDSRLWLSPNAAKARPAVDAAAARARQEGRVGLPGGAASAGGSARARAAIARERTEAAARVRRGGRGGSRARLEWSRADGDEFRRSCAKYYSGSRRAGGASRRGGARRWEATLRRALSGLRSSEATPAPAGVGAANASASALTDGRRGITWEVQVPPSASLGVVRSAERYDRVGKPPPPPRAHQPGHGGAAAGGDAREGELRLFFFHMSYTGGSTLCTTAELNGLAMPRSPDAGGAVRTWNCNLGMLGGEIDGELKGANVAEQCRLIHGKHRAQRNFALEGWQPTWGLYTGGRVRTATVVRDPSAYAVSRWVRHRLEVNSSAAFADFLAGGSGNKFRYNEQVQRLTGEQGVDNVNPEHLFTALHRLGRFDHVLVTERMRQSIEPLRCAFGWPARLVDVDGRNFKGSGFAPAKSWNDTSLNKVEEALRSDPAREAEARALLAERTHLDRRLYEYASALTEMQAAGYSLRADHGACERGDCDACGVTSWPAGSAQEEAARAKHSAQLERFFAAVAVGERARPEEGREAEVVSAASGA